MTSTTARTDINDKYNKENQHNESSNDFSKDKKSLLLNDDAPLSCSRRNNNNNVSQHDGDRDERQRRGDDHHGRTNHHRRRSRHRSRSRDDHHDRYYNNRNRDDHHAHDYYSNDKDRNGHYHHDGPYSRPCREYHRDQDRSYYNDEIRFSGRDEYHHHPSSNKSYRGTNNGNNNSSSRRQQEEKHGKKTQEFVQDQYHVNVNNNIMKPDEKVQSMNITDPRGNDPTKRITTKAKGRGTGRNTESFDPASTLVRPDLRIVVGNSNSMKYPKTLKHDDVVIVPELFGQEDDWTLYYKLLNEMKTLQQEQQQQQQQGDATKTNKNGGSSEWISWHEGAHLITKNPKGSPTFEIIIDKLCTYFNIKKDTIGTRFNWYKDSTDWKPFHHDSAAFNPQRAKNQNITVGVSFGATRELAFIHATPLVQEQNPDNNHNNNTSTRQEKKVRLYFPQTNNGVFSFGRDANIVWKHGINALHPQDQDGKGRISIILWGLAQDVVEEEGSPPLLGSNGQGPHANHNKNNNSRHHHRGGGGNNNHRNHNHRHHHRGGFHKNN